MLSSILLGLLFTLMVWTLVAIVRARFGKGRGILNAFEVRELLRLAKRSHRIEAAILLRGGIIAKVAKKSRKQVALLVDRAIRGVVSGENVLESLADRGRTLRITQQTIIDGERSREEMTDNADALRALESREQIVAKAADDVVAAIRALQMAVLTSSQQPVEPDHEGVLPALEQLTRTTTVLETLRGSES